MAAAPTEWQLPLSGASCLPSPVNIRSHDLNHTFKTEMLCHQVAGRLGDKPPVAGRPLAGLLVRSRGRDTLLAPADLPAYTKLHPGRILQRQALPLTCPFSEVFNFLTVRCV